MIFSGFVRLWRSTLDKYYDIFDKVNFGISYDIKAENLSDDILMTGFEIFSVIIYCSESTEIYQFLPVLVFLSFLSRFMGSLNPWKLNLIQVKSV